MTVIPNTTIDHGANRTLTTLVYEIGRTQILMTGGKDINRSSILSTSAPIDTWAFANGGSWVLASPTTSPSHRYAHAMAYSNDDGYTLVHGGLDNVGVRFFNDLWYYNGTTWGQFATTFTSGVNAPTARFGHEMISADGYNSLFLFGGIGTTLLNHQEYLNDTWLFSTTSKTWTQLTSTNTPPERAYFGGMGYDGYNIWLFGGQGNGNVFLGDLWKMNADLQQWSAVSISGTAPSARFGQAVCWDNYNSVLFVQGGYTVNQGLSNETFNITSGGVSSLVSTPFHPLRKYNASAVFDGGTNTIVLFGGTLLDGSPDGSVFTYNCVTKTWSGAGDFSSAQANGPVSDH